MDIPKTVPNIADDIVDQMIADGAAIGEAAFAALAQILASTHDPAVTDADLGKYVRAFVKANFDAFARHLGRVMGAAHAANAMDTGDDSEDDETEPAEGADA